jgi:hypothetical protein
LGGIGFNLTSESEHSENKGRSAFQFFTLNIMPPRKKTKNFIRDTKNSLPQWFLFTVLISLAPLLSSYFIGCLMSVAQCPSNLWQSMSPRGEFFIVSAAGATHHFI